MELTTIPVKCVHCDLVMTTFSELMSGQHNDCEPVYDQIDRDYYMDGGGDC